MDGVLFKLVSADYILLLYYFLLLLLLIAQAAHFYFHLDSANVTIRINRIIRKEKYSIHRRMNLPTHIEQMPNERNELLSTE